MKLHLPVSLFKMLLVVMCVAHMTSEAALMSSDATLVTYTDFGQNMGRYKTNDSANELLLYLRQQAGGVVLTYEGGQADILLPHEMPDFSRTSANASYAVYGYNATISVQHMPTVSGSMTTANLLGQDKSIQYQGIEYATDGNETFLHSPGGGYTFAGQNAGKGVDHKVTRLSKVVTDVESAPLFSGTGAEMLEYLRTDGGQMIYRNGAGSQSVKEDGITEGLISAGNYVTGGVDRVDSGNTIGLTYNGVGQVFQNTMSGVGENEPLPYVGTDGDSGSPVYVYHNGQYELVGSTAWTDHVTFGKSFAAIDYDREKLAQYDKVVTTGAAKVTLGAVSHESEQDISSDQVASWSVDPSKVSSTTFQTVETTPHSGTVKVGEQTLLQFVGVKDGVHTWKSLALEIDKDNWYHYGNEYLNAAHFTTAGKDLTFADLFVTENLVFRGSAATTTVELDATVDLGIGYARFSADGACKNYVIQSAEGSNHQFNHAGYVIDEGVAVHSRLTGDASHVYEWRKVGDGDLYIEGTGVNKVLLNVGGKGKTYLHREQVGNDEYYAAYNVLASTGATVEIADINQIKRDFTFGNKGGVLDMHGNSMVWNNDNGADAEGFTIHALDEQAVVANLKQGSESVLTWTQSGDQTFLGSFQDNGKGSILQFVYDGGKESSLMLHSIRTRLNTPGSGMVVKSGTLVLAGTHTVHGMGSATGTSTARYENELDWHYADATSNVTVENGAAFELGSHARLTGDITVKAGGAFVMREGVQHEQEYIEGGQRLESTSAIAGYYGLKGDVSLETGATMKVRFSSGTTATNTYTGHITGTGNVEVDAASAVLKLTGTNTFSGTKTLIRGGLLGSSLAAFGDTGTNKWLVEDEGWIASQTGSAADLLAKVHTSSTGTLALSSDTATQLQLAGYTGLYLGAEQGKTVNYGTMGTGEALQAVDGAWRLGGGGGTLVVHYLLSGDNNLLLGADEGSQGTVHLTNTSNSFTGSIQFNGEGIILTYDEGALGQSVTNLSYGNSVVLEGADGVRLLDVRSEGMAMVDKIASSTVNLSSHANLSLGAGINTTFTGDILLAEGQAYRFGAASGVTFNVQTELQSGHDVVIDSQGTSGGKVVLLTPSRLTDSLSVLGKAGSVALELAQDVELSGTLTVDSSASLKGRNVVVSSDSGLVELSGSMSYDSFTLKDGGTLNIYSGAQLDAAHALVVDNGNLNLNQQNLTTKVELKNGGKVNGSGSQISAGAEILATQGTGVIDAGTGVKVYGQIGAEKDATLQLSGNLVELYASSVNTSGGTLDVQCSTLSLANVDKIGGTLSISSNVTINTGLSEKAGLIHHRLDAIDIHEGCTLSIWQNAPKATSPSHVWDIGSLSGKGDIYWAAMPWHHNYGVSRMLLSGENSFEGTLRMEQYYSMGWYYNNYKWLQHLELGSEGAARKMVIALDSSEFQRPSVAINTANAPIAGIRNGVNGGAESLVYAGAVKTTVNTSAPTSTALNTLTITGSEQYTYGGTLVGDATNGLNIVMDGSGTQTFTNTANVVHDIAALRGHLNFTAAPSIHGDVSIAQGAELTLGSSAYTLNSGHTLNVLAGTPGEKAVLNNALVLNGGSLHFEAYSNNVGDAALSTNGVSGTGTTTVSFGNAGAIEWGISQWVASGNWSSVESLLTVHTPEYMNATLSAGTQGLSAVFSMKDGYYRWGDTGSQPGAGDTVVFIGGSGAEIAGTLEYVKGLFDSATTYTVSGGALTLDTMIKRNRGDLVLDAAVSAGNLVVEDAATITGSGQLNVGSMSVAKEAQATITDLDIVVESDLAAAGTLRLGEGARLQLRNAASGNIQLLSGSEMAVSAEALAANLTFGEAGTDSNVALRMAGNKLSLNGVVDVQGNTSLAVHGSGNLTFNSAFNKLSSLELKSGVGLEQNSAISTHLVLDGGHATLSGDRTVSGNITVNAGSILTAGGSKDDTLMYKDTTGDYTRVLTINKGGELALGGRRWSMGNESSSGSVYLIQLNGGIISGSGTGAGNLDFFKNGKIDVTGSTGEISAEIRVRNSGDVVTVDVDEEDDSLTISGKIIGNGGITKDGAGSLVFSAANTYAGTTTVSEGTLRVTSTGSLGSSAVKVNSGATLVLEASSGSSSAVQLDKVTLDSGAALELQGGTYSFNGNLGSAGGKIVLGIDALSTNGAHRSLNGLVEVTSDITVTGGKDKRLDVAQGAELRLCDGASMHRADESSYHIKGSLSTAKNAENVRFTSVDDIHLNYDNNGATGSIDVAEGSDLTLSVNKLQSYASAAINVGKDARLDMSGTQNIQLSRDTAVNLQSGATLALQHLEFSNKADSGTATLKSGGDAYGLDKANYELRNGHMAFNATSQATVKLKLTQSSVENSCGYLLTLDNAGNTLTGVQATKGDITVQNVDHLDLKKLEIAANKTITAANVVVNELAKLEAGATLAGNLELANSATIELGGKVKLDGVLTLQTGLTLSGAVLDAVQGLAEGKPYTLFTGVTGLKLQQTVTLYNMRSLAEQTNDAVSYRELIDGEQVAAADYFSNLAGDRNLVLSYNSAEGTVSITHAQAVPEPTTATLSLLALAGLCARRRR